MERLKIRYSSFVKGPPPRIESGGPFVQRSICSSGHYQDPRLQQCTLGPSVCSSKTSGASGPGSCCPQPAPPELRCTIVLNILQWLALQFIHSSKISFGTGLESHDYFEDTLWHRLRLTWLVWKYLVLHRLGPTWLFWNYLVAQAEAYMISLKIS